MTMCAAITVPIIKDGYRLYPGMPVSSGGGRGNSTNTKMINSRNRTQSNAPIFTQHSSGSVVGSPPTGSMTPMAPSLHNVKNSNNNPGTSGGIRTGIIIGGAAGVGVHHQVVLLQPRNRTASAQPQISARSSFEVGPTSMSWPDQTINRTAMSTSQLYIQKKREMCIERQRQQELAEKQRKEQQCQPSSSFTNKPIDQCMDTIHEERKRKTSAGDHNNGDSESANPFRKLLRRLGFGSGNGASTQQRHFVQRSMSECESGIEQAIPASEAVAVAAWH